jgi:recombination protein RecA
MGKDFNELVKAILNKTDRIFVPEGKTTWRLPTGIPSLDAALGGGLPGGTIVQVYGPETSGKSTLAYHIAAQAVRLGYRTAYIGLEGYSEPYAKACGVDVEKTDENGNKLFNVLSGDFAEEIFNMCIEGIRNYDLKVIVMDSISAAIPKANIDKKQPTDAMDKGPSVGAKARTVGYFIEQLQNPIRRKEALFVTVNQLRSDIGKFVSGLKPGGGMALQYYSDVKISMWGKQDANTGDVETKITVKKGKEWDVIPYSTTTLYMSHGKGVDIERDIILTCEKSGIIKKGGSWYTYIDDKKKEHKYQGLAGFADALRANSKLRDDLYQKVMQAGVKLEIEKDEEDEDGSIGTT